MLILDIYGLALKNCFCNHSMYTSLFVMLWCFDTFGLVTVCKCSDQCYALCIMLCMSVKRVDSDFICQLQAGLFAAKSTGFGAQTTGLFGQQSGTGSTGFSFTQTQPQSTLGGSLFSAKPTASTGFGGFGTTGTTGFSTCNDL